MRFGSVCSGIEAASVAWHPLGWETAFVSEIEPFPKAVLAYHYPTVPDLGDMTKYRSWDVGSVDVVVGGTPCQSFSVAGLRKGLADPRGNLALVFLGLVDRLRPRWVVWENVPGVRSSGQGRDLGSFLGGLGQLGYGWAYRSLDAQYFGLAQRRERVFVVAHLGDWRPPAAVLLERESLSGHPAPSRESGEGVTPLLEVGARTGRSTDDPRAGSGIGDPGDPMFTLQSGKQHAIAGVVGGYQATGDGFYRPGLGPLAVSDDNGSNHIITHSLRADGFDAFEDGTGRGTPLIPFDTTQITSKANRSHPKAGDPCHPLAGGAHAPASMNHDGSHANGGGQVAVAVAIRTAVRRLTPRECERLQGFPDDYTLVPYRGKAAADGPRYRALGNSMAVPVMRWIGARIATTHDLLSCVIGEAE